MFANTFVCSISEFRTALDGCFLEEFQSEVISRVELKMVKYRKHETETGILNSGLLSGNESFR